MAMAQIDSSNEERVSLISFVLSPFGRKVEIALRAKGIVYDLILEDDLKNKSELLLRSNPVYKKVPVLIHKGITICESRFIIEYIEETWPSSPPKLLMRNPYDRYLIRFWADYLDYKIRNIGVMRADHLSEAVKEEYREMWETVEAALPELESRGSVHDGKNEINYLDACLASWMPWFGPLEICGSLIFPSADKCPGVHRWVAALANNSVIASTFPTASQMMDYARKRFHMA